MSQRCEESSSGIGILGLTLALFASPVLVLITSQLLGSFGLPIYNVSQVGLRQAITPDGLQGRMNPAMSTIVWGTIPVGSFIGGILGAQMGIVGAILVGEVIAAFATGGVLFGPLFSLKESPKPVWVSICSERY